MKLKIFWRAYPSAVEGKVIVQAELVNSEHDMRRGMAHLRYTFDLPKTAKWADMEPQARSAVAALTLRAMEIEEVLGRLL